MPKYSIKYLADYIDADIVLNNTDPNLDITNISTLVNSSIDSLSFFTNSKYKKDLNITKAGVVITSPKYSKLINSACIIAENPHLAYAKIAMLFNTKEKQNNSESTRIHPTVLTGKNTVISKSSIIEPYVVIGDNVTISDNSVIKAGVVIGSNCKIGENTKLYPKVVLYNNVTVGNNCIIHSGAIVGSDGFGFAFTEDAKEKSWYKVPQLGGVFIGNDVEIGANTTIDCGAIEDTFIKDGVKLDNQIHIAHNVIIDKHTIIAAQVGIAGSSKIGKYCGFGGGSAVSGHLKVTDGVKLAGFSTVGKSINQPGFYASGTGPVLPYTKWRRATIHFENLDKYIAKIKEL